MISQIKFLLVTISEYQPWLMTSSVSRPVTVLLVSPRNPWKRSKRYWSFAQGLVTGSWSQGLYVMPFTQEENGSNMYTDCSKITLPPYLSTNTLVNSVHNLDTRTYSFSGKISKCKWLNRKNVNRILLTRLQGVKMFTYKKRPI